MKNNLWFILYNVFVTPFICLGFYIGSLFDNKIREGRRGRKKLLGSIKEELQQVDRKGKRILFHCTSAGEWLQALPIIEKMKALDPGLLIMVSFFSPSGYHFAQKPKEVDLKFYLPLDWYPTARRFFRLTRPDLWIISKFDVWPNHVFAASRMGIPIVITSATLSPDSGRDKGISKFFNRKVYGLISHFFPISEADMNSFLALVPDRNQYTVAGDCRYDHVYIRGKKAEDSGDINLFTGERGLVIIAGSTWPADEKYVLPALVGMMNGHPDVRVIIVPHELQESHLSEIEHVFVQQGIPSVRYTDMAGKGITDARVVIFNTIGMLARLYKHTDMAFIGGSFGKGVHNVMEPAIFGQPVLFGPHHLNSYESVELLKAGAACMVRNEAEIMATFELLLQDEEKRTDMGRKARKLILENIGATNIIIDKLKKKYGIIS